MDDPNGSKRLSNHRGTSPAGIAHGGLRINPNNFSPTRAGSSEAVRVKNIKTNKIFEIEGLPKTCGQQVCNGRPTKPGLHWFIMA
jgi:hypothetical protein